MKRARIGEEQTPHTHTHIHKHPHTAQEGKPARVVVEESAQDLRVEAVPLDLDGQGEHEALLHRDVPLLLPPGIVSGGVGGNRRETNWFENMAQQQLHKHFHTV